MEFWSGLFEVIKYVGILVILHDFMDFNVFDRIRDKGFCSVHTEPDYLVFDVIELRIDAWHTTKKIGYFLLFWDWFGLFTWQFFLAVLLNFVLHQKVFFHGLFKRFSNHIMIFCFAIFLSGCVSIERQKLKDCENNRHLLVEKLEQYKSENDSLKSVLNNQLTED